MRVPALCLSVLLALPISALAADGAIEINHARVISGGISPGDAPGYPVTLSAPGSYELTSNLEVPGGRGIVITAANVTVDLRGFTIRCSDPAACAAQFPAVTSAAISADPETTLQNSTVRNGMVRGFRRGIWLANYSLVEKVTATANLDIGILVGVGSAVRDCVVTGNAFGISVAGGSLIEGNVATDNSLYGLCAVTVVASAFRGNVLSQNQSGYFCPNSSLFNAGGNMCGSGDCP